MSVFVISRAGWGAAPYTEVPRDNPITSQSVCFLHHTQFPTLPASATRQQEIARMKAIEKVHLDKGWIGIAYSYVVFPSGRVYVGRGFNTVGAAQTPNTGNAAVCFDGSFDKDKTTWAARKSAALLIRERFHGSRVGYHGQINSTDCPGRNLIAAFPRIAFLAGKKRYAG